MLDDVLSNAGKSNYTIMIGSCESSLVGVWQEEKCIEGLLLNFSDFSYFLGSQSFPKYHKKYEK